MLMATGLLATGLLALAGCGDAPSEKPADKLDARLLGKGKADPAVAAALEDQIMVDPSLANQSNRNAVRPADSPTTAPIPADGVSAAAQRSSGVTLGQLATNQAIASKDKFTGCSLDVDYSMRWATRLPADLPLYPRARVDEAAGSDMAKCKLRAVTFTTTAPTRAVLDFYLAAAKRAGYSASKEVRGAETLIGGTRSDGAAFYSVLTPAQSGGTIVDLVLNNGA
jgi:hypothetical protein